MKYTAYDGPTQSLMRDQTSVIATPSSNMVSQFQQHMEQQQSSVIKTAPGRQQEFSPKQEPLDLAPLSTIQDLNNKMASSNSLEHYYMGVSAVKNYPYYGDYLNGLYPSTALAGVGGSNTILDVTNGREWNSMTDHYYVHPQQNEPTASTMPSMMRLNNATMGLQNYIQHQHQHNQVPHAVEAMLQQAQQHEQQRLYKQIVVANGDMLSPVDSGIGADLAIMEHKSDFFGGGPSVSGPSVLVQQQSQHQSGHVVHHQDQDLLQHGVNSAMDRRSDSISIREASIPLVIPKLENPLGFHYVLEAPISTSVRKEDDKMTYINKGQFYTISFEYILDHLKPLKGLTVRTQIMVVFREDKSYDEEIRTWQMWHRRQHTSKQRILEVDTKNSCSGIIGQIDEIALNAVQFCWNPNDHPFPRVSIAVQCLSTDFSTQKGVKGLPLHIQIDTYDDAINSKTPVDRGYCQIKVFCDKGAERKLRDEDKRANRRKNGNNNVGVCGRKKSDGEFHDLCERSEFYHMSDLEKSAALFNVPPVEEVDSRFFDPSSISSYEALSELEPQPKRPRSSERIMIYVRKKDEEFYTALHLVPPTINGLARAICEKFNLEEPKMYEAYFFKQCANGDTVKIDDDMLKYYSNQDTFIIDIKSTTDRQYYTVTLIELINGTGNGRRPY